MDLNGHGINLYGALVILTGNLHAAGHSDRGSLNPGGMSKYASNPDSAVAQKVRNLNQ